MEYQVLNGISDIINRDAPIILYEIINFDEILNDNSKTLNLLKSFGYSNFYTIKKKKNNFTNFFLKYFLDEKFEVVKLSEIKKVNDYTGMIIAYV